MAPDLNTLPPSPLQSPSASNGTSRNQSPSASRTMAASPHSLAATAAMNAGIQNEDQRRPSSGSIRRDVERARRRSSIRMNLNLNDPAVPAPGEMQRSPSARSRGPYSPRHERAPSLGELHQELEYEQEGQVNRLLNMIRQQQAQIDTLTAGQQQPSNSAVDDGTPTSERSMSFSRSQSQATHAHVPTSVISPLPSAAQPRSRSPFNISRQSSFADRSRGGSHTGSPALRPFPGAPHEAHEMLPSSATGRDESTFYQAETQNLTRENQMLKLRIRELERQLADQNPTSQMTHSPAIHSSLVPTPGGSRDSAEQSTATEASSNPTASAE
ncbi:uncharacterized protein M421DRAFT_425982 [Didymella exigua CBS 183.55]|uniref:Uncharacterized protein n=1 Tax=Didymella exigua CBS 183.55 TaxID=1150837 RepID=A0A6A5R7Y3_9PLEO|nr:uncharacterized protein M421DRAFT_425982 [Didymella exigua CBS 183.55]KAF1923320.1 hypothetical protein M421DRAFT_425982 [Didymella exigua CBS 183.55]